MPFESKAQQRWMFENKPAMAKEWAAATPSIKALPEHVKKAAARRTSKESNYTPSGDQGSVL